MLITAADKNTSQPGEPAPSPLGLANVPATPSKVRLPLEGNLPDWLGGVLYRAGAGRYNILLDNGDTAHISHPFDGLAMIHRFEIVDGEVYYSSRHTSHGVQKRIEARDPTLLTFGPDPCKTIFGRIQSVYHHLTRFGSNAALQENDPEFDMVNVTITPNFPIGERLEQETDTERGHALVVKRDANTLQLVDADTLEPLKMFTYGHISDQLQGQLCASHHQYDEERDEYVNFMVKLGPMPSFQTFALGPYRPAVPEKTKPPPQTRLHEPIWRHLGAWKTFEALKPSYIHSFSMTRRYIILPNFPYYYSFGGLSALYYSCAYQTFYWDSTRHTLFHVVDRHSGRHVATFEADPCFAFHSANAWDVEERVQGTNTTETVIYMDYCTYENTDIIDASFELGKTPTGKVDLSRVEPARYIMKKHTTGKEAHAIAPSQVRRYRLGNLPAVTDEEWTPGFGKSCNTTYNKRRVASYSVIGHDLELPRFNPRYAFKPYRYLYGVCESRYAPPYASGAVVNGLIKLDLQQPYVGANTDDASSALIWDQPGCSCAEPIFVPRPNAVSEDDGVILSTVNTPTSCFLLILDAVTMKELVRATAGDFNAMTLHGSFVDSRGLGIAVN